MFPFVYRLLCRLVKFYFGIQHYLTIFSIFYLITMFTIRHQVYDTKITVEGIYLLYFYGFLLSVGLTIGIFYVYKKYIVDDETYVDPQIEREARVLRRIYRLNPQRAQEANFE